MTKKMKIALCAILGIAIFSSCKNDETLTELEKLNQQISAQNDATLESIIAKMQNKKEVSAEDLAKAQELIDQVQAELAELKRKTPSGENASENGVSKAELEKMFGDLKSQFNSLSSSLTNLEKENFGEAIESLENKILGINTTVDGLNRNYETLSSKDESIEAYLNRLNQTLSELNATIGVSDNSELKNAIADLQRKETLTADDLAKAQALISRVQTELAELKRQASSGSVTLPSEVSKSEFYQLETLFNDLERRLGTMQTSLTNLERNFENQNYDALISSLSSQIQGINTSMNTFSRNLSTLTNQQSNISSSITNLTNDIEKLYGNDENINAYLKQLQNAIDELKRVIKENDGTGDVVPESITTHQNHAYVDLGLSVCWATCNIGANSPEEYGHYFVWGETQGHSKEQYVSYFSLKYYNNTGAYNNNGTTYFDFTQKGGFVIYNNNGGKTELLPEHDAATQNWNGKWRMPNKDDFEELTNENNCEWTWSNSKKGYEVKSKINGKKIFLPAAGAYWNVNKSEGGGIYWSRSLSDDDESKGVNNAVWNITFDVNEVSVKINNRAPMGCTIRPVCDLK